MKDNIEESIKIYATAAEIWNALTDSDELENWWSEDVILEPRVGGKFREVWEDDSGKAQLASGKVLSVKAKQEITFTWKEKDWPSETQTQCSLQIKDEKSHRVLVVTHQGWEAFPEKKRAQLIKDFTLGWNYHLKELKAYLED